MQTCNTDAFAGIAGINHSTVELFCLKILMAGVQRSRSSAFSGQDIGALAANANQIERLACWLECPELCGRLVVPEGLLEVEAIHGAQASHRRGDHALIQD